jgi:hypothetical protein
MAAGVTVSTAVCETLSFEAEMLTAVEEATPRVETLKVAVLAPAETVTVAGTVAAAVFEEVSATTVPPAGAGPLRVTVPVEGVPLTTLVGLTETIEGRPGATVKRPAAVAPP